MDDIRDYQTTLEDDMALGVEFPCVDDMSNICGAQDSSFRLSMAVPEIRFHHVPTSVRLPRVAG